jgi:hypothetical protein
MSVCTVRGSRPMPRPHGVNEPHSQQRGGYEMSGDFMKDRRRALEEAFFAKHSEMLLRRLREAETTTLRRQSIAAASGVADEAMLKQLEAALPKAGARLLRGSVGRSFILEDTVMTFRHQLIS